MAEYELAGATLVWLYNGHVLDLRLPAVSSRARGRARRPARRRAVAPQRRAVPLRCENEDECASFGFSAPYVDDVTGTTVRIGSPVRRRARVTMANRTGTFTGTRSGTSSTRSPRSLTRFELALSASASSCVACFGRRLESVIVGAPSWTPRARPARTRTACWSLDPRGGSGTWCTRLTAHQRSVLSFATGCDRAPIGGLGSSSGVERQWKDDARYPGAHVQPPDAAEVLVSRSSEGEADDGDRERRRLRAAVAFSTSSLRRPFSLMRTETRGDLSTARRSLSDHLLSSRLAARPSDNMDEEDWSSDDDAEITRGRKRAAASEGSEVRPARPTRDWPPDTL